MNDYEKRSLTEEMFVSLCKIWGEEPEEVSAISFKSTGRPVFTYKFKGQWHFNGRTLGTK